MNYDPESPARWDDDLTRHGQDVEPAPITCAECGAEDIEFLPHEDGCER